MSQKRKPTSSWSKVYSEVLRSELLERLGPWAFKLWIAMLLENRDGFVRASGRYWRGVITSGAGKPYVPEIDNYIGHFVSEGMLRDVTAAELIESFEDLEAGREPAAELEGRYLSIKNWRRYQSGMPRFRREAPAPLGSECEEEGAIPPAPPGSEGAQEPAAVNECNLSSPPRRAQEAPAEGDSISYIDFKMEKFGNEHRRTILDSLK